MPNGLNIFGRGRSVSTFYEGAEVSNGHFGTSAELSWVRNVQGPKCPYSLDICYRQDAAQRRQPVFKFTQWPKISILPASRKTMNWIDKWLTPFRMGTTSSTTMQSLGEIEQRAPAVGAIMCLYVCFFCHATRPACCSFESVYFEQVLCCLLWVDYYSIFSVFVRRDCPFRWAR